jgi:hypothetical protein
MPVISITRGAVIIATTASLSSRGGPSDLIGDVSENISQVNWTVYGKIGNIQKKQAFLGYVYNAGGERVVKQYLPYATNQCAELVRLWSMSSWNRHRRPGSVRTQQCHSRNLQSPKNHHIPK